MGRGGQAVLAFFSYKVFTKSLIRTMESASVPTGTFKAMTFQSDSLTGVYRLIRDFLKQGGLRARFAMFGIIASSLFVLSVPTWLSAMTGYTADIRAYVTTDDGSLVPAEEFLPVLYTIHDGSRLGPPYTDGYLVTVPWHDRDRSWQSVQFSYTGSYGCPDVKLDHAPSTTAANLGWPFGQSGQCPLMWVSSRTSKFMLIGVFNTKIR